MVVDKVAFYLGLACSHIGNMLNPTDIVIGGGVSTAVSFYVNVSRKTLTNLPLNKCVTKTSIKLAELGNEAGIIGATSLALQYK